MAPYQRGTSVRGLRLATRMVWVACMALFIAQPSAALEPVPAFGDNPGELAMYLHRPAAFQEGLPLVVALHGCTQTASDFDNETGLVALAEETPFLLVLAEQSEANMARRCFRWYDTDDNRPGIGESASILAMIDTAIDLEGADPERVYVLGLSAGGAMTAVLLANYPNRFAGGAIFAGLPYGCNRPVGPFDVYWNWLHFNPFAIDGADASYACGIVGFSPTDRDPEDWARYVLENVDRVPGQWPLLSIWQGTADTTVDPDNLRELTEQWTAVQGIDATADERQTVGDAVREVYHDDAGNPRVETWALDDLEHAVPIDADGDPDACGLEADYIVNANVCAVRRIAEFWQLQ